MHKLIPGFKGTSTYFSSSCSISCAVTEAFSATTTEGLRFEKREFWSCFALEDQEEGLAAFVQKRKPGLQDR